MSPTKLSTVKSSGELNLTLSVSQEVSYLDEEVSAQAVSDWLEDMGDGARQVCWQSLAPLLISGVGSILSGIILNLSITFNLIKS